MPKQQPKKKRDRAATEKKLIAAGIDTFSKLGFAAATTKMIAAKAGTNESLIARYFEGKEGLLLAIIRKFIDQRTSEELTYPPQSNLMDEILCYIRFSHATLTQNESFLRITISQALVDAKFRKAFREQIPLEGNPHVRLRLTQLHESKRTPKGFVLESLINTIDQQIFIGVLIRQVILGMKEEQVREDLMNFARTYVKGLL